MAGGIAEWRHWGAVVTCTRYVVAVVVSGLLSGLTWLILMQEGERKGLMDHNFNQAMGELLPGGGDTARLGLRWTMIFALILAVLYALVEPVLSRADWRRGTWWALVPFLLWGLVLAPLAGSRLTDDPGGVFGIDGGAGSILVGAGSALLSTLVLVRCYSLMRRASWWRPRRIGERREETIEALTAPGSLELSEEGPEERRVGT
jgi:hypothetical protein